MILVFGATGQIGGELLSLLAPDGVPVRSVTPFDDARERMARAGASPSAIDGSLALAAYQRAGGKTAIVHDTVRQVLGRPPRSLAEFVADHAQFFNPR